MHPRASLYPQGIVLQRGCGSSGLDVGYTEAIHFDGLSAFRRCGRDLVEFFNNAGWAFLVQVDYFRIARGPGTIRSLCDLHHWIFVTARYL
jgi:hypothetical protein